MAHVFIVTKNENHKIEILSVHNVLQNALDKINDDFNSKHYQKEPKYEFGFNQVTINKAFNAIESYHIIVHPDFPSYHIWRKKLE